MNTVTEIILLKMVAKLLALANCALRVIGELNGNIVGLVALEHVVERTSIFTVYTRVILIVYIPYV